MEKTEMICKSSKKKQVCVECREIGIRDEQMKWPKEKGRILKA